jgi:hypothetical protein
MHHKPMNFGIFEKILEENNKLFIEHNNLFQTQNVN